jgi:hypothetical protein
MNRSSENRIPFSALILGLGGAVPFWAGALAFCYSPDELLRVVGLKATLAYGAVILSFLGGIRWGQALNARDGKARAFTLSVLASLAGWVALLVPTLPAISLLIAGLMLQALWDVVSVQNGRLPEWFGRLRMILTILAVLALLLIFTRLVLTA